MDEYWFWKSLTHSFPAGSFYASLVIQSSQIDKTDQVKVIIKQIDPGCQQESFRLYQYIQAYLLDGYLILILTKSKPDIQVWLEVA